MRWFERGESVKRRDGVECLRVKLRGVMGKDIFVGLGIWDYWYMSVVMWFWGKNLGVRSREVLFRVECVNIEVIELMFNIVEILVCGFEINN